jgi:hypothetical protein
MLAGRPDTETFSRAITETLFPHLTEEDRNKIYRLLDHVLDHAWVDEGLQRALIQNICRDFGIEVPEDYRGDSYDG